MFFAPAEEWTLFLAGNDRHTPAGIAWTLETFAVQQGWPAGASLGTETQLMERFAASRDTIRQAARILESRGSARMQRGSNGGLHLLQASVDEVASGLVMHLRAWGISADGLAETFDIADELFAELDRDHLMVQLYTCTRDKLRSGGMTQRGTEGRAEAIARDFIEQLQPIPEHGAQLGSEIVLCERFDSCRSTVRQALRILNELGMLSVKRGRAGGYWLKRPAPMAVIRQVFSLMGSRQPSLCEVVQATWVLNLIQLRLVERKLRQAEAKQRSRFCESLRKQLEQPHEPFRWASLQHTLAEQADNILIASLQRSLVAYQARLGAPAVPYAEAAAELYAEEHNIVEALHTGDDGKAEQSLRRAHTRLSVLLVRASSPF